MIPLPLRAPILYAIHTAKGQIAWKRFLKYDAVRVLLRNRDKRDLDTESFIRCVVLTACALRHVRVSDVTYEVATTDGRLPPFCW